MKIVLHAFGHKLSGVMEVPEETGQRFRLAMTQPVTFKKIDYKEYPMSSGPMETICEFEWTGGTYSQKDHDWDNARIYELVNIDKR